MTDFTHTSDERAREIADNIARVRERLARAAEAASRLPNEITLCAVTKTRPVSDCLAAVAAGVTDLGENYVQEAREKIPAVRAALGETAITCHLIGHLQTNKIKYAAHFTDVFQTVDSQECLQGIAKMRQKLYNGANDRGKSVSQARVLIEVNLSNDPNRAGISVQSALAFAEIARTTEGIALCGFMGMAPVVENPDDARPHFSRLRKLFDFLPAANRQILSMGMSGDFEAAISEGATLVRVGTAIFGTRS